jgi:hypothetical protein
MTLGDVTKTQGSKRQVTLLAAEECGVRVKLQIFDEKRMFLFVNTNSNHTLRTLRFSEPVSTPHANAYSSNNN